MTEPKKSAGLRSLPPLRVWGVNYDCNEELASVLNQYDDHARKRWSLYPAICANPLEGKPKPNDVLVIARHFGLGLDDSGEEERQTARKPGWHVRQSKFAEGADSPLDRLAQAFRQCVQRRPRARYLTPAQLIFGALDCEGDDSGERQAIKVKIVDGCLSANLDAAPGEARQEVMELLYLLRELAYRSAWKQSRIPNMLISLEGRSEGPLRPPVPYTKYDPVLDLGNSIAANLRYVHLDQPMHSLAVGASGVGKTYSMIVPRLKAHLSYRLTDGTRGSALIIDPKKELACIVKDHLSKHSESDRLFMPGPEARLRLFPRESNLSLKDRISLMLSVFGLNPESSGSQGAWMRKSITFLLSLAQAHAITYNLTGQDLFGFLMTAAGKEKYPSHQYWQAFRGAIRMLQEGMHNVRWMHNLLRAHADAIGVPVQQQSEFQFLARFASMGDDAANQISYVTGGLDHALNCLCDEGLSAWLDLTPAPEMSNERESTTYDVRDLIDTSRVIVFQPNDSPSHDHGTALLKAQFYRAALERNDLRQPILFLCDEFQRYITSDRESGEASFLDRCRAYRITAVLATQSVTALYDALAKRHDAGNPMLAVDSILANIAHLFYFQTLDSASTAMLKRGFPVTVPRGWAHPLDVLPLSQLRVGEAYFIAPQCQWGRTQFKLAA